MDVAGVAPKDCSGVSAAGSIVLACAEGEQSKVVASRLGVDPDTVGKWRRRFVERRLEGLLDEPRSGTPRAIEDTQIYIARQSGWEARDNQDGESVSRRGDDCRDDCRAQ
ncbi:helix-turn-helix domain-containing protein, partial [Bradyrhizobium sp. 136]|nr:helix-turn-helix domain-containing protein [Bradyrhizobium sp. 163]MCK1764129.1 helix-turn-helix domain-containing protein [Bradyrhizobium sp. 136]